MIAARRWLGELTANADPRTAVTNFIALLVLSNQPVYPLWVAWLVGGPIRVTFWTFLSAPGFFAVPFVARKNSALGRLLLPVVGIFNTFVSAKAFGTASQVEWFLVPCGLIALLAFRRTELRWLIPVLLLLAGAGLLHGRYGIPLGHFTSEQLTAFARLNLTSVAGLTLLVLWKFGWAIRLERQIAGQQNSPLSPPLQ